MTNNDSFTMELRLCDDEGMVSGEYLAKLNHLRNLSGHQPYVGKPFPCTGSAHLAGEHIKCINEYHKTLKVPDQIELNTVDAMHVKKLAAEVQEFLADAPKDDPDISSLLFSAQAAERVADRLLKERWFTLDQLIKNPGLLTNSSKVKDLTYGTT